jgi:hypothetical protein
MRQRLTGIGLGLLVLGSLLPATAQERTQETVRPCDEAAVLGGEATCPTTGGTSQGGQWNSDGSYTDSSGYTVDGAGRGRVEREEHQDYASFQTSNARFNRIMNRYANRPASSCVTQEEADYVNLYLDGHPELCDAITQSPVASTPSWDGCVVSFTICQL